LRSAWHGAWRSPEKRMSLPRVPAPSGVSCDYIFCFVRLRCLQRANPSPAAVVPNRRSVAGSGTGEGECSPRNVNSTEESCVGRLYESV
jgi:hypothetical protein